MGQRIVWRKAISMTLTAIALVFAVLAGSIYGVWLAHEQAKTDQRRQREKWQRIASASSENRDRIGGPPRPRGQHSTPWKGRRVS